jgi:luciferase family oxidoreductase group 1
MGVEKAVTVRVSVLDLVPITQGSDAAAALRHSVDLARHAEQWGYTRYWVAEHHNMPGIGSAATVVVIAHLAQATNTMRIGAGGIMLPNHAPLVVAEQFGTLDALFPGRIDLGLGRAPGTDHTTARALRRTLATNPDEFPQDVVELMAYFQPREGQAVRAIPGTGANVPLYILGSSLFGAQVAAAFGLPFAFASHFAAMQLLPAVDIYRRHFRPSPHLAAPYVILGVNIVAADTDEDARLLATSGRKAMSSLRAGMPIQLPPPDPAWEKEVTAFDPGRIEGATSISFVGAPDTVRAGTAAFVERLSPDELIVVSHIYDHAARLRSYGIVADAAK